MIDDVYEPDEAINCPHCLSVQAGAAEDFVIPGKEEIPQSDECYECEGRFSVRRNPATGQYEVRGI